MRLPFTFFMGYYLSAFIVKTNDLTCFLTSFSNARKIDLDQGISLIPLTEELFDEMNNFSVNESILDFVYLTTQIETGILALLNGRTIAYVEADYFGGQGRQSGVLWKNGKRDATFIYDPKAINKSLVVIGVVADSGKDEFDTLNLGRHRYTSDWIED